MQLSVRVTEHHTSKATLLALIAQALAVGLSFLGVTLEAAEENQAQGRSNATYMITLSSVRELGWRRPDWKVKVSLSR